MKKLGSIFLSLILCLCLVGCSNSNSLEKTTEKLKENGYTIQYSESTITISKATNGKDTQQFIAYFNEKELESIAYIKLPDSSENNTDMLIGFIYTAENSDSQIDSNTKEAAEEILKSIDLSIDELVEYTLDVAEDEGKSLNN